MLLGIVFFLTTWGNASPECVAIFSNGHNRPLQAAMGRMQEYEFAINDFVNGLVPPTSKYLSTTSTRTLESLEATIEITKKYELLLTHLVERATTSMMSPRIEMKEPSEKEDFAQRYQSAYQEYLGLVTTLRIELENMQHMPVETWTPSRLQDILRTMHSAMGRAHDRF